MDKKSFIFIDDRYILLQQSLCIVNRIMSECLHPIAEPTEIFMAAVYKN